MNNIFSIAKYYCSTSLMNCKKMGLIGKSKPIPIFNEKKKMPLSQAKILDINYINDSQPKKRRNAFYISPDLNIDGTDLVVNILNSDSIDTLKSIETFKCVIFDRIVSKFNTLTSSYPWMIRSMTQIMNGICEYHLYPFNVIITISLDYQCLIDNPIVPIEELADSDPYWILSIDSNKKNKVFDFDTYQDLEMFVYVIYVF